MVKYQQRDGWSHRDALRLARPQAASQRHDQIFHWLTQGWPGVGAEPHPDPALRLIWAFERAKSAASEAEIIALIGGGGTEATPRFKLTKTCCVLRVPSV